MKPTPYEISSQLFARVMPQTRALIERSPDTVELMRNLFEVAIRTGHVEHDGLLASAPYAIAEKTATLCKNPFDWEEFGAHPLMQALANFDLALGDAHRPDALLNQAWVSASCINLWQHTCHRLAGQRVYELSLGLAERLLVTELRGLETNDLRLPYRSIYIVIPAELGLTLINESTGEHSLAGVYVTEYEREGLKKWKLLFWGPPNAQSVNEYDDTLFHFTVSLPVGQSLDEALDFSEYRKVVGPRSTAISEKYYHEKWRPLFKLVMNTVVYCTWPDAEFREVQNPEFVRLQEQMKKHPKGSNKYERTRDRLRETLQQRRIVLGTSLPRFERAHEGSPMTVRVLVSGHWKRQVYGEGRALRKWIFIQPFWRGPDDASESNPRRVLEAP